MRPNPEATRNRQARQFKETPPLMRLDRNLGCTRLEEEGGVEKKKTQDVLIAAN